MAGRKREVNSFCQSTAGVVVGIIFLSLIIAGAIVLEVHTHCKILELA